MEIVHLLNKIKIYILSTKTTSTYDSLNKEMSKSIKLLNVAAYLTYIIKTKLPLDPNK